MIRYVLVVLSLLSLTNCAYFQGRTDDHNAICQQLRGSITMNGANKTPRVANMQRAENAKIARQYEDEGC